MADEMKKCPFCGNEIKAEAIKCRFCGKFLNEENNANKKVNKKRKFCLNGFLDLSFKIGKVFSSILLFVVLFIVLAAGCVLIFYNNAELKTPKFTVTKENQVVSAPVANSKTAKEPTLPEEYQKMITKIIEKHSLDSSVGEVLEKYVLKQFSQKYYRQFLTGLDKYYADALDYYLQDKNETARNKLINDFIDEMEEYPDDSIYQNAKKNLKVYGRYNKYLSQGILQQYCDIFWQNLKNAESNEVQNNYTKMVALGVVGIGLLVFVILLFLPVLIKIEENTRNALVKNNAETEE